MIRLTLDEISRIVGGELIRGGEVVVDAPAVVDSRRASPGGLFLALVGDRTDGHDHVSAALENGAVATLASREVEGPCVVVTDVTEALTRLATEVLAVLRASGTPTVVAVTGSQGKTSVKDMLAQVLEADGPTVAPEGSFNNELGVPLTVLQATPRTRWLVLEMGARGIGHIAHLCRIAPPDVAVVVNVGTAHVGEFGGLDATARAKGELVEALGPAGTAVLNSDDPLVAAMASRTAARVVGFGHRGDVRLVDDVELDDSGHARVRLEHEGHTWEFTVPQIGFHHGMNAAAVFAAATACGLEPETTVAALRTAGPRSPMRMERSVTSDGVVMLNDAYNANPESMSAALRTLVGVARGRSVAVLGTMLELGDASEAEHEAIGRLAVELGVDTVLAVGSGAQAIARAAGARGSHVATVTEAVETLEASLRHGDTVLVKASRSIGLEEVVRTLSH